MFYTLLEHHKRLMFYYHKNNIIDPNDLFEEKISSDDNQDFDIDDITKAVKKYS
jgi:hypothetical protein